MEIKKLLVGLIILLLLILNLYQYSSQERLKLKYERELELANYTIEKLTSEKIELSESLNKTIQKNNLLNEEYSNLQLEYEKLNRSYYSISENYTVLSSNYEKLKDEAEYLIERLDEYAKKINESMSWFALNANINNMKNDMKITLANDLQTDCYDITFNECRIKTACLRLVNEKFYGLRYITDTSLYGKEDKLSSLDDFLSNMGGDCEDYSLFYKAEINHILNKCMERGANKIIIESYVPANNGKRYFINNRETWYLSNFEQRELKEGNVYPYVVCYLKEPYLGHCVVAFSRYKINESSHIYLLDGAELIEPQYGSYVGEIGNEIKLPNVPNRINELMIVISDDDLYSFYEKDWIGYKEFLSQITEMKNKLMSYIK